MDARPAYPRGHHPSSPRHGDTHEYSSLREVYPQRPRHEYRSPESDFSLRPVSPSVIPGSSGMMRAHTRSDALQRAVRSSKRTHGPHSPAPHYSEYSSCVSPRPRPGERFPAPPSLSMKHDPVLYAKYHDMSSSSGSSDTDDSEYGPTEDQHGEFPPSPRYTNPSRTRTSTRESSLETPRSNPSSAHRSPDMHNFRSLASPGPSISSDLPPIFDIGLPPRQDHRSSFASHSTFQSRRPSPSTASAAHSAVHSENDSASPVHTRHIHAQMASPHGPSQDWEAHVVKITNPEDGSAAYQCTWTTSEKTCHYWSKKQLVKRHVETTHLKFKPFVCDICSKAFPQKTSLEIHRHGHTGDTPHQCNYNCGKSFKDPARRHRHHVEVHGYVPKPGKKKQQRSGTAQEQDPSPYESFPPVRMNSDTNSTSSRG